jgi:peptidoglycan/LPS O-acetylase OafA/YrhL
MRNSDNQSLIQALKLSRGNFFGIAPIVPYPTPVSSQSMKNLWLQSGTPHAPTAVLHSSAKVRAAMTGGRLPVMKPIEFLKRNDFQCLCAAAALAVVVWHSELVTKGFLWWKSAASVYSSLGGIGVELFFATSAFIIVSKMIFRTALFALGSIGIILDVGDNLITPTSTVDLASLSLLSVAEPQGPAFRAVIYLFLSGALVLLTTSPDAALIYMLLICTARAAAIFSLACAARRVLEANCVSNRLMWRIGDASCSVYLSYILILSAGGNLVARLFPPDVLDALIRLLGVDAASGVGLHGYGGLERSLMGWLISSTVVARPIPASVVYPEVFGS